MSPNSSDLSLLLTFARIRRQLNLLATHALKPLGVGPKQAALMRGLLELKAASLSELASHTLTDPAATGRTIEGLIRKGWVKQTDHPEDRRRWQVSLTRSGIEAAGQLKETYSALATKFCQPLAAKDKELMSRKFTEISQHLELQLRNLKEVP